MASVDASNSCIPPSCPLVTCVPPLPSTTRGEPCLLDARVLPDGSSVLVYGSGRLVVVRHMGSLNKSFVYRGHMARVTVAKFSPSGAYVASADDRGKLRVWSYDNEEHLCKLDLPVLHGAIRDLSWDVDGKRIAVVGERSDASSECARVIQWDTGVSCGELGQHSRGRAASCALRPQRPMRLVTSGKDDGKCLFHAGPPFGRVLDGTPCEDAHGAGAAIHCVRYAPDASKVASVAGRGDKSVCLYDGKTFELKCRQEDAHEASLYACAWNSCSTQLLTCSVDGTVKLWDVAADGSSLTLEKKWNVASSSGKVPIGGMQLGCAFLKDDVPVSVGMNGQLTLFRGDQMEVQTGHEAAIAGLAIDHERGFLTTADTDGVMVQWDIQGKPLRRIQVPDNADLMDQVHGGATISCLAAVRGCVVSAGWDDAVRFSGSDGVVKPNHIALEAQPNAMASGAEIVAMVTVGGLLLIKDEAAVSSLHPVSYEALSICVSADDSTVYVGGNDCKIHIYNVTATYTLEEKHIIENGHLKPVHALSLSNDGSKLASGDARDICVWNIVDNYAPIISKSRWCFHTQRVTSLAWSPNDEILASGGADDSIYLWSLTKKMKRVHYPFAHRGGVTGLEFLQTGLTLVSVGVDACLNQWDVTDDCAKKFG